LATAGGLAAAIPALQPPRPGVTKANFDRIKDGMTKDEITAIFGREPEPAYCSLHASCFITGYVWFGDDGSVAEISLECPTGRDIFHYRGSGRWTPSAESITDKIRRWLSPARK
jgi:hypothetical protein